MHSVIETLDELNQTKEDNLTNETHSHALCLRKYFSSFKFVLMAFMWIKILECSDHRNLVLQSGKVFTDEAAENIKKLSVEMQLLIDNWPKILPESRLVADGMNISPELKENRRRRATQEK